MIARIQSYLDGHASEPSSGGYAQKIDPRTGRLLSLTAKSDATDVDRAVEASCAALPAWRMRRPMDRGRVLVEIARGLRRNAARLGELESADTGKPRREMPALVDFVAQFFEFYGGLANAMDGDLVDVGPLKRYDVKIALQDWRSGRGCIVGLHEHERGLVGDGEVVLDLEENGPELGKLFEREAGGSETHALHLAVEPGTGEKTEGRRRVANVLRRE